MIDRLVFHGRRFLGCVAGCLLMVDRVDAAPVNDRHDDALRVSGASFVLIGDLQGATREPFESASANLAGTTLWWRWVAPDSGVWQWASSSNSAPLAVTIVVADTLGQETVVAETALRPRAARGLFGFPEIVAEPAGSFVAEAAVEYWIRVDAVLAGGMPVSIPGDPAQASRPVEVSFRRNGSEVPPHDAFAGRKEVDLSAPFLKGVLLPSSMEPGEPRAHPAALGRTVWWQWASPGQGSATIHFGSDAEPPLVAVYRHGPWRSLVPVATSATEFGNECVRYWRARDLLEFDLEAGVTYFLQVDAFPGWALEQSFAGELHFQPAPTNDDLGGAVEVGGLHWSLEATNVGATGRASDPRVPGEDGSSSVWFRWPLPGSGLVQVTVGEPVEFAEPGVEVLPPGGSQGGGVISTWTAGPCSGPFEDLHPPPAFVPVLGLFKWFGSSGDLPLVTYAAHGTNEVWTEVQGGELWFNLDGPHGATGMTPLKGRLTPPPANDTRANRIVLPSASVRVTGRSAGATVDPGEILPAIALVPPVGSQFPLRSAWWEWTAPHAGTWILRPGAGAGDHFFAVYRPDAAPEATLVAWSYYQATEFRAESGETFHIGVSGVFGLGGNVEFVLSAVAGPQLTSATRGPDTSAAPTWSVTLPPNWNQPFDAEVSEDLKSWRVVASDWTPGAAVFQVPFPPGATSGFVRVRIK